MEENQRSPFHELVQWHMYTRKTYTPAKVFFKFTVKFKRANSRQ